MARNLYCVDQNPRAPISCPVCTYSMDRGRFADVPTYKFLFWCPSNKKSTFCRPEGVYGWSRKGPRTVRPSPTPTTLAIESALPCPGGVAGTGHMEVRNFPRAWQPGNALNAQGGYHPVSLDRWIPKTHFSAQACTPKGIIGRNLTALRCRPRCAQCQIVVLARMNGAQSPHFADQRGSAGVVTRAKRMAQTGEAVRRPSCLIPGMNKHHENEPAALTALTGEAVRRPSLR